MTKITEFNGEFRWLSNFAPCEVVLDGSLYPSVENAYQAAKTLYLEERVQLEFCSAGEAKRLGRKLVLRPDWEMVRLDVMEGLLRQKFAHQYRDQLITTGGRELIEGNDRKDTFWGVSDGEGENNLGKLIMKIRREINEKTL